MKYKKQAHCVYHCKYHLVLMTKYRRKIFNEGVFAYFRTKLLGITKYYPEIECEEVNHDEDHVHLMMWIPPKMSISSVVRIVKANTASGLVYWGTDGIWSEGYFVSTVGLDEGVIRRYIEHQGKEDAGQAMLELG